MKQGHKIRGDHIKERQRKRKTTFKQWNGQ